MPSSTQFLFLKDYWSLSGMLFVRYSVSIAEPSLQIHRSSKICMLPIQIMAPFSKEARSRLSLVLPLLNLPPTFSSGD